MAQTWGTVANISNTMGVNINRVCIGEASRQDIGCPTYAPSVTTSGQFIATSIATGGLTVTGATSLSTLSATVGAFNSLTVGGQPVGPGALDDRITSSTTAAAIANQSGGTISFTLGGTPQAAYLHPSLGLIINSVSTTGNGNFMNVNIPSVVGVANGQLRFNGSRFAHIYQAVATDGANTFLGISSGNTTMSSGGFSYHASYNTGVGASALSNITTGYNNTAAGVAALINATTGYGNVAVGVSALNYNTAGAQNTGIGPFTLRNNSSGDYNVALGYRAGFGNGTGSQNIMVGMDAGYDISTSNNNTVVGYNTGRGIISGGANTILGANVTGLPAALSNSIILADGDGNRRINVDAAGRVGIGTTNPSNDLTVSNNTNVSQIGIVGSSGAGGFLTSSFSNQLVLSGGAYWNGSGWIATNLNSSFVNSQSGFLTFTTGTASSVGSAVTLTEHMRITSGGRVGVGTTNPTLARLESNGGNITGVAGYSTAGYGILGESSMTHGIYGRSTSPTAAGVLGYTQNLAAFGLLGYSNTYSFYGVGAFYNAGNMQNTGIINTGTYFQSGMPGAYGAANYVCFTGTGVFDSCTSLRRHKKDIRPIDMGLSTVRKLQPVAFTWKNDGQSDIGFIAEDITAVDKRFGQYSTSGTLAGVKYPNLTALLTKATQELDAEVTELKQDNVTLKARLAAQQQQINELRALLNK